MLSFAGQFGLDTTKAVLPNVQAVASMDRPRHAKNDKSPMPTYLGLSSPHLIYPNGDGRGGEAPPKKMGGPGCGAPRIFLILMIKNTRFS